MNQTADQQYEIYQNGFKEGQKHSTMSPDTKEEIVVIKQDINTLKENSTSMKKDIEFIRGGFEDMKEEKKEEHKEFNNRLDKVEKSLVRFTAYGTIALAVASFLAQLLSNWLDKLL